MTSREFCYWLQGLFELTDIDLNKNRDNQTLSIEQVKCIKNHLNLVFKHEIDPSYGDKKIQEELLKIHNPFFRTDSTMKC